MHAPRFFLLKQFTAQVLSLFHEYEVLEIGLRIKSLFRLEKFSSSKLAASVCPPARSNPS